MSCTDGQSRLRIHRRLDIVKLDILAQRNFIDDEWVKLVRIEDMAVVG